MQSSKKSDRNWVFSEWPATSIVQYKVLNGNKDETSSIVRRRGRTVAKVSLFCKVHNQRSNWNSDIGSETVILDQPDPPRLLSFFWRFPVCGAPGDWRQYVPLFHYGEICCLGIFIQIADNDRLMPIINYKIPIQNIFVGIFVSFFFVVVLIRIISNIPETSFSFKDCF